MMETPTVYVVQEVIGRNFIPAAKYGTLKLLIDDPHASILLDARWATRSIQSALKDAKEGDYLLPSGDPVAISIAAIELHKRTRGRFSVLKWDNREHVYVPIEVCIS